MKQMRKRTLAAGIDTGKDCNFIQAYISLVDCAKTLN